MGYNLLQRPPYLIYEKLFPPSKYIEMEQVTAKPNVNGTLLIKLKIKKGFPGIYYLYFNVGGISSTVLKITTDMPVHTLKITKQPKSQYDQETGNRVGDPLEETQITVYDIQGRRLPKYTVIAALYSKSPNITKFKMDFTQSENVNDSFLVMSKFKIATTD